MLLSLSGTAEHPADPEQPLRVRIRWAPRGACLRIQTLTCCGVPLTQPALLRGGEAEFQVDLPTLPARAHLRWALVAEPADPQAGTERERDRDQAEVDEIRIEVRDGSGRWHLLGERLGGAPDHREWASERQFKSGPHRVPPVVAPGTAQGHGPAPSTF